jgi:hypothetical protein
MNFFLNKIQDGIYKVEFFVLTNSNFSIDCKFAAEVREVNIHFDPMLRVEELVKILQLFERERERE